MIHYLVRWEIDIVAESPLEAAEKARRCQTRPGTQATVFDVFARRAEAWTHLARIDLTFPEEFAAAAEIEAALKAITDCYGVGYKSADQFVKDIRDFMLEGRAALAKARGETP